MFSSAVVQEILGLQTDKKWGLRLPTVTLMTLVIIPLQMMNQSNIIIVCIAFDPPTLIVLDIFSKL